MGHSVVTGLCAIRWNGRNESSGFVIAMTKQTDASLDQAPRRVHSQPKSCIYPEAGSELGGLGGQCAAP